MTELPKVDPAPSFEHLMARAFFPDLFEVHPGELAYALPVGFAERIIGLIGLVSGLQAAAMEPTVRAIQARNNMASPNATPSPSDLVRFELREVFRAEDRHAALTPAPSDTFIELMRRHGLDRYHAESYWAAHWDLPGLEKGFEMLHRLRPGRVEGPLTFTASDMRDLLKKQDVLPIYHDRLMAVSYAPLTRVDVRRMYKLGVLSKSQVSEAYKDLGYNDANAGFLADFTERDVKAETKELTRGDWLAAYREGIIGDVELTSALLSMGYDDDSAAFTLRLEKARKDAKAATERARHEKAVATIGRRVRRLSRAGRLDEEVVRLELEELDVSDEGIARFFATYKVKPLPASKDLSRADELAAFRLGIVDETTLRERLARLGLDERETSQLIATERAKMKKPAGAGGKDLSKGDIMSLLKKGVMDPDEAHEGLTRIGYDANEAEKLILGAIGAR